MAGDGVDQLLRPVELLEQPQRGARVAVLGVVEVRVALVVEVVDERRSPPTAPRPRRARGRRRPSPPRPRAGACAATRTRPIRRPDPRPLHVSVAAIGALLPSAPMEKFVIKGGPPLSGEITAAGNKNAALPILAACLLTEEEVVLTNVPRIRDTETQVAVLEGLGVQGRVDRRRTSCACRPTRSPTTVPTRRSRARIRASFLLAGPLLARFGEARMPPPGGDFIGRRRLDPHLDAFTRPRRPDRGRPRDRDPRAGRRAEAVRDLHGRAVGDGNRERAHGRGPDPGPDHDRATPPASRTSRTSPGCWSRWAPRSTASART